MYNINIINITTIISIMNIMKIMNIMNIMIIMKKIKVENTHVVRTNLEKFCNYSEILTIKVYKKTLTRNIE